ncbi:MAG TPA: HypC/HybG/HupF family hydrogenase formation chaperone [Parafilimonas sp.]|nr:HypC/HybG/HupF family hydrogenase formation chaperone [Parafilimonas sp.]
MCLAIPGKIQSIEINDGVRLAKTSFGGIIKNVTLELLPEAQVNDYILVHVGVAISKVDEEEALTVYKYLEELGELTDLHNE